MNKYKKRKIKKKSIFILFMIILCIFSSAVSIYSLTLLSGIETLIRSALSGIIICLALAFTFYILKSMKNKTKKYLILLPFLLVYSALLIVFSYYVFKTYNVVDNFSADATTYSSSIVTLKTNSAEDIKDVEGKVGYLSDKDNIIGNTIPKEVIKKQKLDVDVDEYESYIDLIDALYEGDLDFIFLPTSYVIMFSTYEGEDLSNIGEETKIIHTEEKTVKTKSSKSNRLTKPFSILLMGVDSENEELSSSAFNGDSLMLITFNPDTLNATILSIPRDTYVPIACFSGQAKSKITHAAWYGESCMIDTIENFTGVDIDYYVKINFKGVVKIVDTLGGIDVDVPYSFCESNSDRMFGDNTIYVREGFQTLDGEQALAFSRNRHSWPQYCGTEWSNYNSNDFVRGQNQQMVVKAILNKLKEKGDLQTIYKLLDTVSNSMETNMSNNEILSLYNIGKDVIAKSSGSSIDDVIGIQRLYLSGWGGIQYDEATRMNLYDYNLYQESLDAVVETMEINLGKKEIDSSKMVKEFSFDIDEEYEENIIGQMDSGTVLSTKATKSTSSSKCGVNEELGADGVTCVCKYGYTRINGTCTSKEEPTVETKKETKTCGVNEELGADQVTCVCKNGYSKVNGVCTKEEDSQDTVLYKNQCVGDSTNGYYYYDSSGEKNPTKYIESTCTNTQESNDDEPEED